jgi:hypothetical protein
MRRTAILAALGLVAALVSGCALDVGESLPAPRAEQAGKEEQAFDASLFRFSAVVPDDGHDASGGSQRAVATLNFWDGRQGLLGQSWNCLISVWLPLRLNYVVIPPGRAAEMTAVVADASSFTVMHSQPSWPLPVIFCKRFAAKMEETFKKVPGGPTGAKVTSP